jgi:hypothetical protein
MLNLVRFRDKTSYPDGREATGAEAYAAYARASYPVFSRLGGRIVWRGSFELTLIGACCGEVGRMLHRRVSLRRCLRGDDPRSGLS